MVVVNDLRYYKISSGSFELWVRISQPGLSFLSWWRTSVPRKRIPFFHRSKPTPLTISQQIKRWSRGLFKCINIGPFWDISIVLFFLLLRLGTGAAETVGRVGIGNFWRAWEVRRDPAHLNLGYANRKWEGYWMKIFINLCECMYVIIFLLFIFFRSLITQWGAINCWCQLPTHYNYSRIITVIPHSFSSVIFGPIRKKYYSCPPRPFQNRERGLCKIFQRDSKNVNFLPSPSSKCL